MKHGCIISLGISMGGQIDESKHRQNFWHICNDSGLMVYPLYRCQPEKSETATQRLQITTLTTFTHFQNMTWHHNTLNVTVHRTFLFYVFQVLITKCTVLKIRGLHYSQVNKQRLSSFRAVIPGSKDLIYQLH